MNANDRFSYMDVNNNGSIDRNEWNGSLQEFYSLDRNNDGRITRDEFNATGSMTSFNAVDSNRRRPHRARRVAVVALEF